MSYLDDLDEYQREAVTAPPTPLKVIAGAGAGKTRVIVSRIAHQIDSGVCQPEQMFVAAFTRAAADEMSERVQQLVGGANLTIGTFHSLMFRLLNTERTASGQDRFNICKESQRTTYIKGLLDKPSKDFPSAINVQCDVGGVGGIISRWKNHLIHAGDPEVAETLIESPQGTDMWGAATIYPLYEKHLADQGVIDFDDMLLKGYDLLAGNSGALDRARAMWKSFHVDEAQDLNISQWKILELIAPPADTPNITVVGDPRQALYRFRGATPEMIDGFTTTYKGASEVNLRMNYRCGGEIVRHANLMAKRFKVLPQAPARPVGNKPSYVEFNDPQEQAAEIARYVSEYRDMGDSGGDVAVLVRTNGQSADIESAFVAAQLPYWCQGGGFFDRMEIGDVMSYLRLAVDRESASDLNKIINRPTRYLGRVFVEAVEMNAAKGDKDLVNALRTTTRYAGKALFQKQLQSAQELADIIDSIDPDMSATAAIKMVLDGTDYIQWLRTTSGTAPSADDSRKENLDVLVDISMRHGSVRSFVDFTRKALALQVQSGDATEISTIHRAKGREWPVVFCANFNDGSLPHTAAIKANTAQALDDEQRIAYVAMTRAKDRLFVCIPMHDDKRNITSPSRFVTDMGFWPERADTSSSWWDFI